MGGFTQRPWTPTKRRGAISAEFTSPGPACVTLPNLLGTSTTDSKKGRAPAFSFGARHGNKNDNIGPGPGQYNITGLSAKGKDCPPAVSLHSRSKEEKVENTPAPGDYEPQKSDNFIHDNSPRFTFGLKTQVEKPSATPAPNTYKIPGVLGATKEGNKASAPAFSLSGRAKEPTDDRVHVPGPGTYNSATTATLPKSPAYSVSSRLNPPTSNLIKPGPGSYSPEKVQVTKTYAPSFTFGIRHSDYSGYLNLQEPYDKGLNIFHFHKTLLRIKTEWLIGAGLSYKCITKIKDGHTVANVCCPGSRPAALNLFINQSSTYANPFICMNNIRIDLPPAHSFGIRHSEYSFTM